MAMETLDCREHTALSTCRTLNPYMAAALLGSIPAEQKPKEEKWIFVLF